MLLLVLNFVILSELTRNYKRKNKLLNNNTNNIELRRSSSSTLSQLTSTPKKIASNSKNALKSQKFMILFFNLNYFLGHFSWFLSVINRYFDKNFWFCFSEFSLIFFYLSYTNNIFIYYRFNRHFADITHQYLNYLLKPFLKFI